MVLVTLFCAGGASCPRRQDPTPVAFAGPPTLQEVIHSVNANSNGVRQLQATGATISVHGIPALRADLVLERPRRFRVRAELMMGLGGTQVDLGSNDEVFWVRGVPGLPPGVYFARHDQFSHSAARQFLPVEPLWLIEALGVVYLDPAGKHEGPFSEGAGRTWIRSRIPSDQGELTKVTVVHDTYGWILEQHVYDWRGQLLASARASKHRYYPLEGVSLPDHVEIQLPPAQVSFQISVSNYLINQLYGDPVQLWSLPHADGSPLVNLADPGFQLPVQTPDVNYSPYPDPRAGYRPRYRGYSESR
jgi:hypothetical protein